MSGVKNMLTKPSALRNEHNIISQKYRDELLDLRKKLLSAEANRLTNAKTYSIAEVSEEIQELIDADV